MIEILYLSWIVLLSFVLGQRILRFIKIYFKSYVDNFVFSVALGFSIFAYTIFLLGSVGLLYRNIFFMVLLFLSIILLKDIKKTIIKLYNEIKIIRKKLKISFNFYTVLILILLFLAFLNFIISFAPPYNFDTLAYHLAVPKIYLDNHKIVYIPSILFSNLPALIDYIYMGGLLLYKDILSNLFAYTLNITLVLAIYSFCNRLFNYKIGIISALIFYSSPLIIPASSITYSDIPLALFSFLSIYSLILYFIYKENKFIILTSIFVGLTASSKIFGAVPATIISLFLVYSIFSNANINGRINCKTAFKNMMLFFLIASIIFMPWIIKTYYYTENPIWPFLHNIFNGKNWDEEHASNLKLNTAEYKPEYASFIEYIKIPLSLSIQSLREGSGDAPIRDPGGLGPFLIAILPLYFFISKKNKHINFLITILLIAIVTWLTMDYYLRHLTYALPLLSTISAYVIFYLFKHERLSSILKILLLFTFTFGLLILVGSSIKKFPVAIGLEEKEEFLLRVVGPWYEDSEFINLNLPNDSRILLFRDNRGYYIDREYVWGDPLWQAYIDYSKFKNTGDLYKELKKLKITHIMVNNNVIREFDTKDYRYSNKIVDLMNDLLEKKTINAYNEGNVLLNQLE